VATWMIASGFFLDFNLRELNFGIG
jgi:hypothetical protein